MKKYFKPLLISLCALALFACEGTVKSVSSGCAEQVGADWVVVELREADGTPYRCWKLEDVSISNEKGSDGIYWRTRDGHLVHVSGSYDRVQVRGGKWGEAFSLMNMTEESCNIVNKSRYNAKTMQYEIPSAK